MSAYLDMIAEMISFNYARKAIFAPVLTGTSQFLVLKQLIKMRKGNLSVKTVLRVTNVLNKLWRSQFYAMKTTFVIHIMLNFQIMTVLKEENAQQGCLNPLLIGLLKHYLLNFATKINFAHHKEKMIA